MTGSRWMSIQRYLSFECLESEPEPHKVQITVRCLGLATGQTVIVRRVKHETLAD